MAGWLVESVIDPRQSRAPSLPSEAASACKCVQVRASPSPVGPGVSALLPGPTLIDRVDTVMLLWLEGSPIHHRPPSTIHHPSTWHLWLRLSLSLSPSLIMADDDDEVTSSRIFLPSVYKLHQYTTLLVSSRKVPATRCEPRRFADATQRCRDPPLPPSSASCSVLFCSVPFCSSPLLSSPSPSHHITHSSHFIHQH